MPPPSFMTGKCVCIYCSRTIIGAGVDCACLSSDGLLILYPDCCYALRLLISVGYYYCGCTRGRGRGRAGAGGSLGERQPDEWVEGGVDGWGSD